MAVTHYDVFYDDEDYTEKAMCGTIVGENYEHSNNWNYVSCKKCLKQRRIFESEIESIARHRSEQDGAFVDYITENY